MIDDFAWMLIMDKPTIELNLPPEMYARIQQLADERNRSIESVLLDGLVLLFGEQSNNTLSVDDLHTHEDEQLWAIVHQRLVWSQDARLQELVEQGKQGTLSTDEQIEMEQLIQLIDQQMLLRSEALLLLKQRGQDIEPYLQHGA